MINLCRRQAIAFIKQRSFHSTHNLLKRTPFNLADIGEGISEVELIQWFVKEGDEVEEFSRICEVQSDKAAVEISSRYKGKILKLYHETGAIAKVGHPLVDIDTDDAEDEQPVEQVQSAPAKVEVVDAKQEETAERTKAFATPAVRRVAKENNVNIDLIPGTGPKGRVLKGDVLEFIQGKTSPPVTASAPIVTAEDKIMPLTAIQKAMFKSMTKSLSIPHFGFCDEITINAASKIRQEINAYLKSLPKGTYTFDKISYMPIFLKAASEALKQYPILNAKVVNADTTPSLQNRSQHNIGIAMDTPQGLVVPNVKNCQSKSILEIAADLEALKVKGKAGKLTTEDLQNGTFTLSNVGNIGGTSLHPVLVSSEVCIGALGKVQRLPRFEVVNGVETVVAKEIMHASFNADHRVIDGATVARFVQLWKLYLESPSVLTLNLK